MYLQEFFKSSAANFTAYLTYHSYGQYLLYPWGYDNAVPPDHEQLNAVGNSMAKVSVITNIYGIAYIVAGYPYLFFDYL